MIRVRKLVLAIAAATSLSSGLAQALGLGEISLQSALNQPLNADIGLLEIRDLDETEIIPRLASAEDFSKAGVERDYFLTGLRFTPVILPNGKSIIRVTSTKPIREPYLNFLVEVIWPSGRLLREYTLLLDPPLYSPETAAAAPQLPVAVPTPVSRVSSKSIDGPFKAGSLPGSTYSAAPAQSDSQPAAAAPVVLEGEYKSSQNDTLWSIAQRVNGGAAQNQTMLAIQDLNPNAFSAGNINRLKSGQVLRLPDAAQINARSSSEASAAVAEQNAAWRERRDIAAVTARQLDATNREASGTAPAEVEATDSLRLVAGDAGEASAPTEKAADLDSKTLSEKLAVTQESLDTSRRQGDELKGRAEGLQGQVDNLQSLIQLKDSQLAQLQADLAAREQQAELAASAVTEVAGSEAQVAESVKPPAAAVIDAAPATEQVPAQPAMPAPETAVVAAVTDTAAEAVPVEVIPEAVMDSDQPVEPVQTAPEAVADVAAAVIPAEVVGSDQPVEPVQIAPEAVADVAAANIPAEVVNSDQPVEPVQIAPEAVADVAAAVIPAEVVNSDQPVEPEQTSPEAVAEVAVAVIPAEVVNSVQPIEPVQISPAEIVVEAQPEPVSLVDEALGNPWLLGAGLLVVLLGLMAISRRNAQKETDESELASLDASDDAGFADEMELPDETFSDLDDAGDAARRAPEKEQAADALGEADVYIAYGKFNQAAELLEDAISDEPQRSDLQLKLLEVLAELGDREGFLRQVADLEYLGGVNSQIEQVKSRYPAMAAAGFAAGVGSVASSASAESDFDADDFITDAKSATAVEDKDDAFDLDELGIDADDELNASAQPSGQAIDEFSLDIDFDAPVTKSETDSGFDLNFDEMSSESLVFESKPADDAFADFTLDIDSDGTSANAGADELSLASDFDLSAAEDLQPLEPIAAEIEAQMDYADDEFSEFTAETAQLKDEAQSADDEDFDFLSGTDETATKLDLARAYIDMGDAEGARDILDEVLEEGSDIQQQEARELIGKLA